MTGRRRWWLLVTLIVFSAPNAGALQVGDRVEATVNLRIRNCNFLSCTQIDLAPAGARGTLLGGPLAGDGFSWWLVEWDDHDLGYSAEGDGTDSWLVKTPDLVVQSFSLDRAGYAATSNGFSTITIRNDGGVATLSSRTRLRLAACGTRPSLSDPLLADVATPGVDPGQTIQLFPAFTLPQEVVAGQRCVWLVLDATGEAGQEPEDEENDFASIGVEVISLLPDLIVDPPILLSPQQVGPGAQMTVTFSVKNQGVTMSEAATTNIHVTGCAAPPTNTGTVVSSVAVPPLLFGGTVELARAIVVPTSLPPGTSCVWIILDVSSSAGQGTVNELNDKVSQSFVMTAGLPDLVVEELTIDPTSSQAGISVSATVRIRNQGTVASASSIARLRLAGCGVAPDFGVSGVVTIATPPLSAGSEALRTAIVGLPLNHAPGQACVWMLLDADNTAGQSAEGRSNDFRSEALSIGTTRATPFEFALDELSLASLLYSFVDGFSDGSRLSPPTAQLFDILGPTAEQDGHLVFSNLDGAGFGPGVPRDLVSLAVPIPNGLGNATVRGTFRPDIPNGVNAGYGIALADVAVPSFEVLHLTNLGIFSLNGVPFEAVPGLPSPCRRRDVPVVLLQDDGFQVLGCDLVLPSQVSTAIVFELLLHDGTDSVTGRYSLDGGLTFRDAWSWAVPPAGPAPVFRGSSVAFAGALGQSLGEDSGERWSISGTVERDGIGFDGVAVDLSGTHELTMGTFASGLLAFIGLENGSYEVSPSLAGYQFDPPSRFVVINGQHVGNVEFKACEVGRPLIGAVIDARTGAGLPGITVQVDGTQTTVTGPDGSYTLSGVGCGSHVVRTIGAGGYGEYARTMSTFDSATWNIALTSVATVFGTQAPSAYSADPVNVATGNYVYSREDLRVPAPGIPFVFERTYNSQAGAEGAAGSLGFGWSHNWEVELEDASASEPPSVVIRWGDGRTETWTPDGSGGFTPQYGVFDTLRDDGDGSYSLRRRDLTIYDFDSAGRLVSVSDRNGNTTTLVYSGDDLAQVVDPAGRAFDFDTDGSGRITEITDPLGRTVQFTYDAAGNLVTSTDPKGNSTHYAYDDDHQMVSITDPRGHTLVENEYDGAKRVVSVQRDALGTRTTYVYEELDRRTTVVQNPEGLAVQTIYQHDDLLRLIREEDARGEVMAYEYDARGNRIRVVDRRGFPTEYEYDERGNVISKRDPLGNVTTITYDAQNNPLTRTDALGHTTQFEYDANGNLERTIDALGGETLVSYDSRGLPLTIEDPEGNVTTHEYDAEGNRTKTIDALSRETMFTYDAVGRLRTRTDARSRVTEWVYDANDNVTQVIDPICTTWHLYDENDNRIATSRCGPEPTLPAAPAFRTTWFEYDEKDRLTRTMDPAGEETITTYDALDRRKSVTDRRGNTTSFDYDEVGNLIGRQEACGRVTSWEHDANGNRTSQTDGNNHTTLFRYDAMDRLTEVEDHRGNTTRTVYDELGRVKERYDQKDRKTSFEYDALGRLTRVTDPADGMVVLEYDRNGNRTALISPNDDTTLYEYDALDRLERTIEPLGGVTLYEYDAVGNRVAMTDPNGAMTTYAYDAGDRVEEIDHPGGPLVTYSYDAAGNRLSMVDGLGTTTYAYDPVLERLASVTDSFGKTVGYEYDEEGNRTVLRYPEGHEVEYGYDACNRMESVSDWMGGLTTYAYDPAGRLTETQLPNGTRALYGYDEVDRLTSLDNLAPDDSVITSQVLELDEVGNSLGETRVTPLIETPPGVSETYTHEPEDRLLDRMTILAGMTAYAHDANGNLIQADGPEGSATNLFDARNLLIARITPSGLTEHRYDGDGRRMARIASGSETRFVLDTAVPLFQVIQETDAAGSPIASYVYGLGLIERIDALGTRHVYHGDRNGNTLALTDGAGAPTGIYTYGAFGEQLAASGSPPSSFTFLGLHGVVDEADGLHYVRARFYDAATARFLSKDPKAGDVEGPQSLNRYAYALNRPLVLVDVSGLSPSEGASGIGATDFPSDSLHGFLVDSQRAGSYPLLALALSRVPEALVMNFVEQALEDIVVDTTRRWFAESLLGLAPKGLQSTGPLGLGGALGIGRTVTGLLDVSKVADAAFSAKAEFLDRGWSSSDVAGGLRGLLPWELASTVRAGWQHPDALVEGATSATAVTLNTLGVDVSGTEIQRALESSPLVNWLGTKLFEAGLY